MSFTLALAAAFASLTFSSPIRAPSIPDTTSFTITGDVEAVLDDATSFVSEITRLNIWKLTLRSPRTYKEEKGHDIIVSLFFSRKFEPEPGTYPIQFSYLNAENVMGGSVVVLGEEREMYSNDTEGEVTFDVFGDRITGSFHFVSNNGSDDDRREVSVEGTFDCDRGKALNVEVAE
ncbi:MAG: hypothetical protein ACC655_04830 [Rhodothermia bacterium]